MKFDELVQHLSEMALAGVHRATRDFGLKGKSKYAVDNKEQQGIAIMQHQRLEKKIEAEIDPHNVLPPLHIVLHDVSHPMRKVMSRYGSENLLGQKNITVIKRSKQLSTPDNIVLVASPTIGKGGVTVSPYAIIHNWAHNMPYRITGKVLILVYRAMIDLMNPNEHNVEQARVHLKFHEEDLAATKNNLTLDSTNDSPAESYFAIPSSDEGELVYNMFYQYVKFGRITFRFATREQLMPYTQQIIQLFDNWVNSQKGKVVSTRITKLFNTRSGEYIY